MTLNPELLKAILSMDAYNRGYDASITLPSATDGSVKIGSATIVDDLSDASAQVIGFYALAYDTNNDGVADIISYRGTDYPENDDFPPKDVHHGWTLGGGFLSSEQGELAVEFYQEVVRHFLHRNNGFGIVYSCRFIFPLQKWQSLPNQFCCLARSSDFCPVFLVSAAAF